MPSIRSDEITTHPAIFMNQSNSAGGVINNSQFIASNVVAALISDISEAERLNGTIRYYKTFKKIGNPENKIYKSGMIYLAYPLQGQYTTSFLKGTFTDVWSDASGNREYGCGALSESTTLSVADQTIVIDTRGASYEHFQNGDLIVVSDQKNSLDVTGHIEFVRIDQNVSWNGDEATVHVDTPLRYAYNALRLHDGETIQTRIASCLEYGDVIGTAMSSNNTSVHGTTNDSTIVVNSIAGITQTFTITFDSSSEFNVVSNVSGITLPSGSKLTVYEPENPDYLEPYLTIPSSFWVNDGAGDWAAGDSVKINTNPCAMPMWIKIIIPAGAEAAELETVPTYTAGYSGSA